VSGVLVDTSVWIDHFRKSDPVLQDLLVRGMVLSHPLLVLEIACGTPPAPRAATLSYLRALGQVVVATSDELLDLVERERLYTAGSGAVDVNLLASALLTPGVQLWTRDKSLEAISQRLKIAFH
jgi:predicted nucleic acid-binding protein